MNGSWQHEIALGVLTRWCPPELVDAVIDKHQRREQRRRLLPARTMVYFELARCLFPSQGYEQVFEQLLPADADHLTGTALFDDIEDAHVWAVFPALKMLTSSA